jgi:hypothetical protein
MAFGEAGLAICGGLFETIAEQELSGTQVSLTAIDLIKGRVRDKSSDAGNRHTL